MSGEKEGSSAFVPCFDRYRQLFGATFRGWPVIGYFHAGAADIMCTAATFRTATATLEARSARLSR